MAVATEAHFGPRCVLGSNATWERTRFVLIELILSYNLILWGARTMAQYVSSASMFDSATLAVGLMFHVGV